MMLAADVDVQARLRKRHVLLKRIEQTYEYKRASMTIRAAMPDPEKEMFTKRQGERAVCRWRALLRVSGADSADNLIIENGSQLALVGDVGPDAGDFYPLLRMFTVDDVECLA